MRRLLDVCSDRGWLELQRSYKRMRTTRGAYGSDSIGIHSSSQHRAFGTAYKGSDDELKK
jgi:hypothetical protein